MVSTLVVVSTAHHRVVTGLGIADEALSVQEMRVGAISQPLATNCDGQVTAVVEVIGHYGGNFRKAPLQGRPARRLGMKRETTVPRATSTAETQKPVMNPCSVGSPLAKV